MIEEGKLRHFYNEMAKGGKPRRRYEQFVEEEEARYKAQMEDDMYDVEPYYPCYLCDKDAETEKGVAYYRFYDYETRKWINEAICETCLTKLKGSD